MKPSIVDIFIASLGDEKIFLIDGDYLPLLITVDWFYSLTGNGTCIDLYPFLMYRKDGRYKGYWSLTRYHEMARELAGRYIGGALDIPAYDREYATHGACVDACYDAYFRLRETRGEAEMLAALREAHDALRLITRHTLALDAVEEVVLEEVIRERGMKVDLQKVLAVSHLPSFVSFEVANYEAILAAKESDAAETLQYVFSNYTHIASREETRGLVAGADATKLRHEINERKADIAKDAAERKALIAALSEDEKRVLSFIDWSGQIRDNRKAYLTKCDVLLFNLVEDLYERWGLEKELVPVSLVHEVLKGREAVLAQREELRARLTKMAVLYTGEGRYIHEPELDEAEITALDLRYLKQNTSNDADRISGDVASKGKARGIARVITQKADFGNLAEGEVLVTGMTRPEYVPLMKKAAAIVTDEGGITSHAAIVSRELKKPCIIGTRIATRLIQDGDLVEVDAEKGVVTILEHAPKAL